MAQFYSEKFTKKSKKTTACRQVKIQSLDYQGLGVAKIEGKTWFIENVLPGEEIEMRPIDEKRQYGHGKAVKILKKSSERQLPSCAVYRECGGCQMQHIPLALQRETKQKALFQRLQKLQNTPIDFQPMIVGEPKGYRRRTRLSIALQAGKVVMGFRQQGSNHIIPLTECEVLLPSLSALLPKLSELLTAWQNKKALGHIELVQADNTIAMLFRHVGTLSEKDSAALKIFAAREELSLFVMISEQQIAHWCGQSPYYVVSACQIGFSMRDFIQVNAELNAKMVSQALAWLAPSKNDRILDLFCGVGNFTLPLAKMAGQVVGVEGVIEMVQQAKQNAEFNQLENVAFYQTNLDEPFIEQPWAQEPFNKVLLDPARNGAWFCLDHLCALAPERICYVSCNPATLVRDAQKLIEQGYRLEKVAMIDMFPQTGHLESISVFVKAG